MEREELTEKEFEAEMYAEFAKEEQAARDAEHKLKVEFKNKLKGLINVSGLYKWLTEGHDGWIPVAIVDVIPTHERRHDYPNYPCARIENDARLFMKTPMYDAIRGTNYYYVWQICHGEDWYSGELLFELKNGKFFQINYSC